MIQVIEAPNKLNKRTLHSIFLAGSIEMGEAEQWQQRAIEMLNKDIPEKSHKDYVIFDPRRKDWDSSWEQKYENPQFYQQVKWELSALAEADYVIMYFDPNTKSPITLLELGLFKDKCIVVCPEGFWRKGNVDIICDEFEVEERETLEKAIEFIVEDTNWNWEHED